MERIVQRYLRSKVCEQKSSKKIKTNNYFTIISRPFVSDKDRKYFSCALVLSSVSPSQTYTSQTRYQKVQSFENVQKNILRLNLAIFYIL